MENPSQSNQAQLCRNGCGFYGNSKNDGMCSICYKDNLQKKNSSGKTSPGLTHLNSHESTNNSSNERNTQSDGPSTIAPKATRVSTSNPTMVKSPSSPTLPTSSPIAIPSAANPNTSLTSPSTQSHSHSMDELSTSFDSSSSSPSKMKKNRCASCRKRLGLTGFHCRCGNIYCSLHRYSDQHACGFDYRADAQAKIRKENPVVVGEKINKI